MRQYRISDNLKKKLIKLFKKNKKRYYNTFSKIREIANTEEIAHYKNLRKPLNNMKRVHVDSSFVLLFEYDQNKDEIFFIELEHHDKVYRQ